MVEQDVTLANSPEEVGRVFNISEPVRRRCPVGRVPELWLVEIDDRSEPRAVEKTAIPEDVFLIEIKLAQQQLAGVGWHGVIDLESNGSAESSSTQFELDSFQQIVGIFVVEGQIGVAGYPKRP